MSHHSTSLTDKINIKIIVDTDQNNWEIYEIGILVLTVGLDAKLVNNSKTEKKNKTLV